MPRFKEFLTNNPSMKINIHVKFNIIEHDDTILNFIKNGGRIQDFYKRKEAFTDVDLTDVSKKIPVQSRRYEINNQNQLDNLLNSLLDDVLTVLERLTTEIEQYEESIRIYNIDSITVHYDRYNPTRASSYIELPKWISSKGACINIQNNDNKCFKYSIQCGVFKIHDCEHPGRVTKYKIYTR